MKTIIVKWVPEEVFGYGKAMRVIESSHKRFIKGSRFDFGFFSLATDEGYTIISLPKDNILSIVYDELVELMIPEEEEEINEKYQQERIRLK